MQSMRVFLIFYVNPFLKFNIFRYPLFITAVTLLLSYILPNFRNFSDYFLVYDYFPSYLVKESNKNRPRLFGPIPVRTDSLLTLL